LSGHVDSFIEIDKQPAVQMVKDGEEEEERWWWTSPSSLDVCVDLFWRCTDRNDERRKKNRSFTLRSVSLPYVWLNADIYKKKRELKSKKKNIVFFFFYRQKIDQSIDSGLSHRHFFSSSLILVTHIIKEH
jgi:hypothetical protein